jgi:hypothetical protein
MFSAAKNSLATGDTVGAVADETTELSSKIVGPV